MRKVFPGRAALACALIAMAGVASAQGTHVTANGISAAGETAQDRAPLFSSAAYVAPANSFGLGVQAFTDRRSLDAAGVETIGSTSVVQLVGHYGLTSRVTVGAYVPFTQMATEIKGGPVTSDNSESGLGDLGLFGRAGLFESQSGATRFALGGEVTLATGDEDKGLSAGDPTYRIEGALSHRMNRWSFHAVPGALMIKDLDPFVTFNLAGVYAFSDQLGLSLEALSTMGGADPDVASSESATDIDLGAGARYRFAGNSAFDLGVRYNVSTKLDPKPTVFGLYAAVRVTF